MRRLFVRFLADETAATAIEYALIAAGVSITIVGAVQVIGGSVTARYTSVGEAIK